VLSDQVRPVVRFFIVGVPGPVIVQVGYDAAPLVLKIVVAPIM
jgi:hypothetical protein